MRLDHLLSKETWTTEWWFRVPKVSKGLRGVSLFNFEGTLRCKLNRELVGGLAQLGERLPCKQEVSGSIPLISTKGVSLRPHSKRALNGKSKQSGVTELWTKRASDTAGANGTKLLRTTGQ